MEVLFDYRNNKPKLGRTRSSSAARNNAMYTAGERIREKETNSVELGPWLDNFDNKKKIYNMRLFYVLLPNSESVVKFGIAGTQGEAGAWGRLHQYINEYGYTSDLNACTGIQLLYLAGNQYNPTVKLTDSEVFQKERACKQYFRQPEVNAHILGRGFERFKLERIQELFDIIDDPSNKDFGDVETERRVSERLSQQNLTADDYVVKIIGHTTKGGKVCRFRPELSELRRLREVQLPAAAQKQKRCRQPSDTQSSRASTAPGGALPRYGAQVAKGAGMGGRQPLAPQQA